jgi:hypothetical protein
VRHPALVHAPDRDRVEVVDPLPPPRLDVHQPGVAEHGQMLHEHVAVEAERAGQLPRAARTLAEHVQNRPAGRMGQGPPDMVIRVV